MSWEVECFQKTFSIKVHGQEVDTATRVAVRCLVSGRSLTHLRCDSHPQETD